MNYLRFFGCCCCNWAAAVVFNSGPAIWKSLNNKNMGIITNIQYPYEVNRVNNWLNHVKYNTSNRYWWTIPDVDRRATWASAIRCSRHTMNRDVEVAIR